MPGTPCAPCTGGTATGAAAHRHLPGHRRDADHGPLELARDGCSGAGGDAEARGAPPIGPAAGAGAGAGMAPGDGAGAAGADGWFIISIVPLNFGAAAPLRWKLHFEQTCAASGFCVPQFGQNTRAPHLGGRFRPTGTAPVPDSARPTVASRPRAHRNAMRTSQREGNIAALTNHSGCRSRGSRQSCDGRAHGPRCPRPGFREASRASGRSLAPLAPCGPSRRTPTRPALTPAHCPD